MKKAYFILLACIAGSTQAEIFKCTDGSGNTSYQAKPCADKKAVYEINVKTGSRVDVVEKQDERLQKELERQRKLVEQQKRQQLEQQWSAAAKAEQEITRALIQDKPKQFSIYAIPPYQMEQLPPVVQQFKNRLPEIEKLRRLAAQKALQTGNCVRVEADELSPRSKKDQLVILVDCSSGESFYFNEAELSQ